MIQIDKMKTSQSKTALPNKNNNLNKITFYKNRYDSHFKYN
ncbi:hypothetical protein VCRA2126O85_320053 [Vibrio crassostreae]|nr:hypothetical protein VCRA2125O83_310053 [Vibrio crassostreae]CAK2872427.1 hypothetical protein VCRA2126O85_320053 [Vibrio crassostreae]CAK2884525.1 hypothetical protein VCRA2127O91_340053 [Vibrio crassostreae]CAK3422720.1 hypothetical protein VCRA2125O80_320009 [Vibrio crassostreae]CAK3445034.1 hypothetical protein VCRA2128O107_310009 [Vibrio crassostreae]